LVIIKQKTGAHSIQQDEVPKLHFFKLIIGQGESGKAILNETLLSTNNMQFLSDEHSFFSGAVKIFLGKSGSASPPHPLLEKLARTPMVKYCSFCRVRHFAE